MSKKHAYAGGEFMVVVNGKNSTYVIRQMNGNYKECLGGTFSSIVFEYDGQEFKFKINGDEKPKQPTEDIEDLPKSKEI